MRGLWKLTWLEIRSSCASRWAPSARSACRWCCFVVWPRVFNRAGGPPSRGAGTFVTASLPIFRVDPDSLSAVHIAVTIISIYREGGILKRLRATPLRPYTILTAHVLVKRLLPP